MKPAGKEKSLPPWLQKGKDKEGKESKGKGGKPPPKGVVFGAVKRKP
jgi:hypothetical protein